MVKINQKQSLTQHRYCRIDYHRTNQVQTARSLGNIDTLMCIPSNYVFFFFFCFKSSKLKPLYIIITKYF
jgi:hypothetical protein